MKLFKHILEVLAIGLSAGIIAGCQTAMPDEITDLGLTRCLEPMNLKATVSASLGDVVTFKWDVTNDAEQYNFEVYEDEAMSTLYFSETLDPDQVPYTVKMDADMSYWFKVQAVAPGAGLQDSKWAIYDSAVKTYAVKDPLFLKVADRQTTEITVAWSTEVSDFEDVTHITYGVTGSGKATEIELSDDEIAAGSCTITGLSASTEYDIVLYYASASRGEVDAWTMPDLSGTTEVSTSAALEQAMKDGANIFLKMEGSPYTIGSGSDSGLDVSKGCCILGETAADGTRPVIVGAVSIAADFTGGFLFEGVDFSGNSGAVGHPICLKNGGTGSLVPVDCIIYRNCALHGYSKGLIYEWNQTFKLGELTWDSCDIYAINEDGSGGGDVVDFRGKSEVEELNIVNSTIYNGMRTFVRLDAGVWGKIAIENNTMRNLCLSDNTNNAGIIAINKDNGTEVGEFTFKNNLLLDMPEKATLGSGNAKYFSADDLGINFSNNWYYNLPETFFTDNFASNGTILESDPCHNAKGGYFNIKPESEVAGQQAGAPKWWIAYVEEPEDLTQGVVEEPTVWDLSDAKYFSGTIKKQMVRQELLVAASEECPVTFEEGTALFEAATVCNKKGVPADGYLMFKVNTPGSVVIKPTGGETAHVIVATAPAAGGDLAVKGGASTLVDSFNPQKIVVAGIEEETCVYVYASGAIGISELAWSEDVSAVNRALPAPAPGVEPKSFTQGEATDLVVSWEAVENAETYSVVFSGKSYTVEETEYTIESSVSGMLDAGSYEVEVYANPGAKDIYNITSEAGKTAFAVLPKAQEGSDEFIVSSVEELLNAISAGKDAITLKYSDKTYEVGALTITAPLHLKGQSSGEKKTPITISATLSGEIGGSVVFRNLEFAGEGASVLIDDKTNAPVADTVAIYDSYLHDTKALYDNSGKATSDVQYVIFKGNIIEDCSAGADFIDMRAGAHHKFLFINNTVANSCRTFVRTDAGHEMNYATIRNNTFYKVATNSSSKDNNGILHIRSAAGQGLLDYKVQNNLFYSILIDEDPSNAAGFPKLRSKGGLTPNTIMNNYFFNCEDREEKAAYSFWSYLDKAAGTAGGGAILPADPCKDAENGDFTLTNGVAMNANVGDPRWNPARGGQPTSEITVSNVDEFLTAVSAGKKVITLSDGEYDLTAVTDNADVSAGKLTIVNSLTVTGTKSAVLKGGFQMGNGVDEFTLKGITLSGASSVDNAIYVTTGTEMSKLALVDVDVTAFKNRLIYQDKDDSSVASVVINKTTVTGVDGADFTSGDFIDFRKGGLTALKVTNSTFANGIRTFIRMDAGVVCNSVLVENNTFYNIGYVLSKDNNGVMHVRSTTATDAQQVIVRSNIFAGMKADTDGLASAASNVQAAGFPHLVSKASAAICVPVFAHNYFYDLNTEDPYSFWQYSPEETATAGYGVVLTEDPFKDAANGDFTLVSALAASEKVGDQRWNTSRPSRPDGYFEAADLDALLTAIDAGKKEILLTGSSYDFTANETLSGKLSLAGGLTLKGQLSCGVKPEIIGTFDLAADGEGVELNNLKLNGASSLTDMIVINAAANLSKLALVNCDITAYKNRLISGPNDSKCGPVIVKGCIVTGVDGANFTSGDFIDFRKGTVTSIKATGNTFVNCIRTFVRADANVICGSIAVENNTFYGCGTAVSKDNNGIMHVRSGDATKNPRQITCRKNIFASAQPDEAALADAASNVQAAGFPHLISGSSAKIAVPVIADNLFYDLKFEGDYNFWTNLPSDNIDGAGTVLTESPFTGDPASGKFTVATAYKGYGDVRW